MCWPASRRWTRTARTSRCRRARFRPTSRAPGRTCAAADRRGGGGTPMAVPGRKVPVGAPPDLAETELFSVDAYLREFDATVEQVDREQHRVALRRTAFFPGGGGQPHDLGTLRWGDGAAAVVRVGRDQGRIWHWLDGDALPSGGAEVEGELDWQ